MQRYWFPSLILLFLVWIGTEYRAWSPSPYWPDAGGYASHVAENRWVAHPPGYPFFVWLGHGFHTLGFSAYRAVQAASVVLALAGVLTTYFLIRPIAGPKRAAGLAAALGFSWITLLIAQTGTSHAGDLFTVAFLLGAILRFEGFPSGRAIFPWVNPLILGGALVLCAGFRLTTLLMMGPLLAVVAWRNRFRLDFWMVTGLAAASVVGLQLWVIREYGGYPAFSAASQSQHGTALFSSILLVGFTETSLFNFARTVLWLFLGGLPFFAVIVFGRGKFTGENGVPLLYGVLAFAGVAAGAGFYLCTHPGYVAGALPGLALAASVVWRNEPIKPPRLISLATGAGWLVFLTLQPFALPLDKPRAILNGVLLQYGAESARNSVFLTTAEWLREGGLQKEIPENRARDLHAQDLRAQPR